MTKEIYILILFFRIKYIELKIKNYYKNNNKLLEQK